MKNIFFLFAGPVSQKQEKRIGKFYKKKTNLSEVNVHAEKKVEDYIKYTKGYNIFEC